VLSENRSLGRFEALRSRATPLVGREEEMNLLLRRWSQAKTGSGRVVLISAEPGIGKSRIAEALMDRIAGEPHIRLRYFCSPHHQDSALYPIVAQMERAFRFARDDAPQTKLAKLRALLDATGSPPEDVALIVELHSLPATDLAPSLDVSPQRKERIFEALLRQIERLSGQQPLLMVFEDIHWIDPSSREMLDRTIERIATWPVLLVATFRPEFQPPWTGQPHLTTLNLSRLDRREAVAIVQNLAGNALTRAVVEEIAERTDGVPLFVEELTKAVLESGAQGTAALSAVPHPARSVPATLHASLMARLDRLGPAAKDMAQTVRRSVGSLGTSCWRSSPICRSRNFARRSIGSRTRVSCLYAVRRRNPRTCSSTRWCRMPPMAHCCAAGGSSCTRVLRQPSKTASQRLCWPNPRCWPGTARKPGCRRRRWFIGSRPVSRRSHTRR
jgi:hypothetical protein